MKTMLISFACLLFLTDCRNLLEENLEGNYSNASFYKTEAHALLAVSGIYNACSFSSYDNILWVFGDVASDDAVKGSSAGDQSDIAYLEQFNYNRSNSCLDKIWKRYYEGISRANYFLYYGRNIQMQEALKNRLLNEAKFIRAYFYFNLVNIFGEIPLKLNPPLTSDDINKPKSSATDVYAQIEKDLGDAIQALPVAYPPADVGRATKGAALGLLAKAHLYQRKWDKAADDAAAIEALGIYSLRPKYADNFIKATQNNSESLFEMQHISGQIPNLGNSLVQWLSPRGSEAGINGWGFDVPVENLVKEYEKTAEGISDPRLDYTIGRPGHTWSDGIEYNPGWSASGYSQRKNQQSKTDAPITGDANLNYVYLRYADILLIKAEALNEQHKPEAALLPLNQVRKRARESYLYDRNLVGYGTVPAGLLPEVVSTDEAFVRDAIRHERRVELAMEFHRFFDLMRYGKTAAEQALSNTHFKYETHRFFLIPQSELDANPLIK